MGRRQQARSRKRERHRDGAAPPTGGTDPRAGLGRGGEDLAVIWLRAHGYRILARNWRPPPGWELRGELDIVASDGDTLVFVEVKTRRGEAYGGPFQAVTGEKRAKIRALATAFLASSATAETLVRFDVIAVWAPPGQPPRIRHLPEAF